MTTQPRPKRRSSPNAENDLAIYMVALQRLETAVGHLTDKVSGIEDTLGWTGRDEHGALIGKGIAGNVARLEGRVDRRFGIYDGVTKWAAGATTAAVVMSGVLWFVIKHKLEAIFQ